LRFFLEVKQISNCVVTEEGAFSTKLRFVPSAQQIFLFPTEQSRMIDLALPSVKDRAKKTLQIQHP
jgi:hypothetical protein